MDVGVCDRLEYLQRNFGWRIGSNKEGANHAFIGSPEGAEGGRGGESLNVMDLWVAFRYTDMHAVQFIQGLEQPIKMTIFR